MNVFLHVDESGAFDERFSGGKASVVGGVCSVLPSTTWDNEHCKHLSGIGFGGVRPLTFAYPKHYHCGPLLARKISGPENATDSDLRKFSESVFQNVLEHSLFGFISRNRGKRFEYSPQATYVMNLVAALRCAFEQLAQRTDVEIDRAVVTIAQRTVGETVRVDTVDIYMMALLSYISDQLAVGDGTGVALARRLKRSNSLILQSGVADRDAGLIAADFVCCLARQGVKPKQGCVLQVCNPDQNLLLGDYQRFHERQVLELLQNRYYGSCLEFMCRYFPLVRGNPDIVQLLRQLEEEKDSKVLDRELPALLAVVHQMVKTRSEVPHMLSCVTSVVEKLVEVAERCTACASGNTTCRNWLNLEVQALAELAACHNHTGAVGPQEDAEVKIKALLKRHKGVIGLDALERQTFILEVRNRNLNLLFNDYRFEDAYSLAEELVAERRAMVGAEESDELLGQILASQGQACAFMARLDPSWNTHAVALFQESMQHFLTGSRQDEMSRNFIVTTHWQARQFHEAFGKLPLMLDWCRNETDVLGSLCDRVLLPYAEKRAFDVVNCLRIAAGLVHDGAPCRDLFSALPSIDSLAQRIGTDHPYEHWWKWLGVLYLFAGDVDSADRCFCQAVTICNCQSFTMKTIGSSIILLRIAGAALSAKRDVDKMRREYTSAVNDLRAQSIGFDAHMFSHSVQGGLEDIALTALPGSESFWGLCTYLPFAYS